MKSEVLLIATLFGLTWGFCKVSHTLINTKLGQIRGVRNETGFTKYSGVPYGILNSSNIFGAGLPHPGFDGIFEANNDSKICVRADHDNGGFKGTVDCLNLDIYVPDAAFNESLPVMVWIHGGGFIDNYPSPLGTPEPLLSNDVIVVTINYRLGIWGFLCLDIPEVPGNTGLRDQELAFKWIKDNIDAFGGDPNSITIFGESSGGISVNFHLFSPTEQLFDKAIIQSGPATMVWATVPSNRTFPFRIAEALGYNTTDIYEALDYIASIDALTVAQTSYNLNITNGDTMDQPLLKPCVEKSFDGVESVITDYPMNIKSEKISKIPLLMGNNDNEYALMLSDPPEGYFDTYSFNSLFTLGFNMSDSVLDCALEFVKHYYLGDEPYSETVKTQIADYGTDFIWFHPTRRMVKQLIEDGAESIYQYVFSYGGNDEFVASKNYEGAGHGEELYYLFGEYVSTENDRLIADRMGKLWTNFAKYGNPTPNVTELLPVTLSPVTETLLPYIDINVNMTVKSRPFHDRVAFWDLFYEEFREYQRWYKGDAE